MFPLQMAEETDFENGKILKVARPWLWTGVIKHTVQ